MGTTIASHGVTNASGIGGGGPTGSGRRQGPDDGSTPSLGERIEGKLEELFGRTEQLLVENRAGDPAASRTRSRRTRRSPARTSRRSSTGCRVPLIDGRLYADRRNSWRRLEAYHEARARRAQRARARRIAIAASNALRTTVRPVAVTRGDGHAPSADGAPAGDRSRRRVHRARGRGARRPGHRPAAAPNGDGARRRTAKTPARNAG